MGPWEKHLVENPGHVLSAVYRPDTDLDIDWNTIVSEDQFRKDPVLRGTCISCGWDYEMRVS